MQIWERLEVGFIQRQNSSPAMYEPMKSNVLYASKHNDGRGIGQRFPFQKREMGKKKGAIGPEWVQDLAQQTPWAFTAENSPLWLSVPPSRLTGGQCHLHNSEGCSSCYSCLPGRDCTPMAQSGPLPRASIRACENPGHSLDDLRIAFRMLPFSWESTLAAFFFLQLSFIRSLLLHVCSNWGFPAGVDNSVVHTHVDLFDKWFFHTFSVLSSKLSLSLSRWSGRQAENFPNL